ncbi:MAG: hypothetical protein AB1445_13395 [Bacillota bacterium]
MFGVYGLGLLIMMVNYAVAGLAISIMDACSKAVRDTGVMPLASARRWLAGVGVAVLLWAELSLLLVDSPEPVLSVAAVQPGGAITSNADLHGLVEQTRDTGWCGARASFPSTPRWKAERCSKNRPGIPGHTWCSGT